MMSGQEVPPTATLSVVSHGQGNLLHDLLADLRRGLGCSYEVIVTLNIPEDERFLAEFADLPIRVVRNVLPKGFGANHNAAFCISRSQRFVIVNPDIRFDSFSLHPLLELVDSSHVGACGPLVLSPAGSVEDSARRMPSVWRLVQRVIARTVGKPRTPDYCWNEQPIDVDWLAGMFVLFRRDAFTEVSGFDERYFMYFEDADICRRLRRGGWSVLLHPGVQVVHEARRASYRSARHMGWHFRSALRFLAGL